MPSYFDFEVSLLEVTPRPWRRFLLRTTASFHDLHEAIQVAAPWWDYHLYAFWKREPWHEPIAGIPDDEPFGDPEPIPDGRKVRLAAYFRPRRRRCVYTYDFGDEWNCDVLWRGETTLAERFRARLLDGAEPFPPEDCGGIGGYEELRYALATGDDPDDRAGWAAEMGWKPEFDLAGARRRFNRKR